MKRNTSILILILGLGLGLRLWGVNQSLWLDEASQAQQSVLPIKQIWSGRVGDFHPPLFYLMAHAWLAINHSEVWARLLPIGIGLVGIFLMTPLAESLLFPKKIRIGRWSLSTGTCASFILAINPFHIYYSQEFRMYSLLGTLGIWAMLLFVRSSRWLWIPLTLMLYTHYATFLLLPTMLIYSFLFDRKKIKLTIGHWMLSILLYFPWLPQFVRQLSAGVNIDQYLPGWRELLTLGPVTAIPLVLFKLVAGRINFVSRIAYAVYAGFVLSLVGTAVILAKDRRALLLSWLFFPLLVAIALSFIIPLTQPFRLIFILPALILIFVQAIQRFPRLTLLFVVYISITAMVMYISRPRLQREQWRQTISYLQTQATSDSAIVVKFSDKFAPFYWYSENLLVVGGVPTYPASEIEVKPVLAASLASVHTVYLVDYLSALTDPNRVVDRSLENLGFARLDTTNFEGVGFIHRYAKL